MQSSSNYATDAAWPTHCPATTVTAGVDVAVVVDAFSFTTTLSVAADAGIVVLPY